MCLPYSPCQMLKCLGKNDNDTDNPQAFLDRSSFDELRKGWGIPLAYSEHGKGSEFSKTLKGATPKANNPIPFPFPSNVVGGESLKSGSTKTAKSQTVEGGAGIASGTTAVKIYV